MTEVKMPTVTCLLGIANDYFHKWELLQVFTCDTVIYPSLMILDFNALVEYGAYILYFCGCNCIAIHYRVDLHCVILWVVSYPMIQVVQVLKTGIGVKQSSVGERLRFGLRLQRAFDEFVRNFLPHMEEEEQVFQVGAYSVHSIDLKLIML